LLSVLELKGSISVREAMAAYKVSKRAFDKASKRAFDGATSGSGMHTSAGNSMNGGRALRSRGLAKTSFKGAAVPGFCDFVIDD
jgi:hypothetical protein